LAAQEKAEKPAAPPPQVQKVFILKYADPRAVHQLLSAFGVGVWESPDMHALSVSATPQTMQAIEDAIARLDVPAAAPKDVSLVMHLVIGSDTDGATAAVPKELDKVVSELHNTFPFKNYRLLDVLTLRARTGQRASTQSAGGALQFGSVSKPVLTNFAINSSSVAPDGTTLRLDGLRVSGRIPVEQGPGEFNFWNLDMSTDVDIKEGQQVVIGRQGLNKEQALFLVLSAHVVQ
jgi:hypothetical protein